MIVTALPSWERQTGNHPSQAERRSSRACPWPDVCPASKGFQRAVTDSSPGHALEVRPSSARSRPARGKPPAPQALGWWEALAWLFPSLWTPSESGKEGVRAEWFPPQVSVASERLGLEFPLPPAPHRKVAPTIEVCAVWLGRTFYWKKKHICGNLLNLGRKGERGVTSDSKATRLGNLEAKSGPRTQWENSNGTHDGDGGRGWNSVELPLWLRVGAVFMKIHIHESWNG